MQSSIIKPLSSKGIALETVKVDCPAVGRGLPDPMIPTSLERPCNDCMSASHKLAILLDSLTSQCWTLDLASEAFPAVGR